jgi:hypothetical protein
MMATNVFPVGSNSIVRSVTRNSSTNAITVDISAPTVNFDVLLAGDNGKSYHITTPSRIRELRQFVTINPGEERDESIAITFGKNIEAGNYDLKATRDFTSKGREFALESNSIKVTIIK